MRSAIADERVALSPTTSPADRRWQAPSLCTGWTVHGVVAHVSQSGFPHTWAWIAAAIRHGSPDGGEDVHTRAQAAATPAELVRQLRASASSTYRLPLSSRWDPYVDLLVHGRDALRPFSRTRRYLPGCSPPRSPSPGFAARCTACGDAAQTVRFGHRPGLERR
ncbi:hypothetical protein HBB16_21240 [Pseudonocardia sp. MCCB 268]|nr:hypothetical protein [Pseudonocardia cytotoxica]